MKKYLIVDINGVLILNDRWGNARTNTELIDYLQSLKSKFSFAILTNNAPEIEAHMEAVYKIPKFYDHFISAGEYSLSKSDPKIFLDVMAKLQATPEQCIFVDDTEANVNASVEAGLTGILYRNFQEFKKDLSSL